MALGGIPPGDDLGVVRLRSGSDESIPVAGTAAGDGAAGKTREVVSLWSSRLRVPPNWPLAQSTNT